MLPEVGAGGVPGSECRKNVLELRRSRSTKPATTRGDPSDRSASDCVPVAGLIKDPPSQPVSDCNEASPDILIGSAAPSVPLAENGPANERTDMKRAPTAPITKRIAQTALSAWHRPHKCMAHSIKHVAQTHKNARTDRHQEVHRPNTPSNFRARRWFSPPR